ncbi:Hypothetical protein SLIV_18437 [Streptomyces lividans TK24]|uniref:Secreted protein n=1 Tax=Streptomyces lividans TK24 TaxID=457428 RepID=A0ABX6TPQ2_STRLI|nr:Hypothetical protein SLIV_18437 [Streptomyces lividans TK24]QSJ10180.1 Hypothetical protein SLIVDG2_18437 [Streptomyces lividans]QTD71104.1 Hypothetical protein SLIVYQS_18437 [Streptomyces lividans TK24] [Streptomyces lividans]
MAYKITSTSASRRTVEQRVSVAAERDQGERQTAVERGEKL